MTEDQTREALCPKCFRIWRPDPWGRPDYAPGIMAMCQAIHAARAAGLDFGTDRTGTLGRHIDASLRRQGLIIVPTEDAEVAAAVRALPDHVYVSQDRGEDAGWRWEASWDYDNDGVPAHRVYGSTLKAAVDAAMEGQR